MAQSPPEITLAGRPLHWLLAGIVFLGAYVVMAEELNFFQMQNLQYVFPQCGRMLWRGLAGSMIRYFDAQQLSSMLWKVVVLLPALLCFSVALVMRYGERLDRPCRVAADALAGWKGVVFSVIVSAVVILLLVTLVFRGNPLVDDEPAYLFQARTYLTGAIALPPSLRLSL